MGDIPDVVAHEFECPLGDPSRDIAVADDVSEWVSSDDRDFVVGEVVQELLHLGVPDLRVGKYLTDKVHGSLYLELVSRLLPFDDQLQVATYIESCSTKFNGDA